MIFNQRKQLGVLANVFVVFLACIGAISRLVDRNSSGGFTFWTPALVPDGANYYFKSLEFAGVTGDDSITLVNKVFKPIGLNFSSPSTEVISALDARPLYPLLSSLVPDISAPYAMLVFPLIAWFFLSFVLFLSARRIANTYVAAFIVFLFSSSYYCRYNLISSTTDALCILFSTSGLIILILKPPGKRYSLLIVVCFLLAVFTRPVDPIILTVVLTSAVCQWNVKHVRFRNCLSVIVIFIHMIYIQVLYKQLNVGSVNTGSSQNQDFISFILHALILMPKIVFFEFGLVFVRDPIMFAAFILCGFSLAVTRNRIAIAMVLAMFFSSFYLGALNGTIGSGFRYEMLLFIVCLIVIAAELPKVALIVLSKYKLLFSSP